MELSEAVQIQEQPVRAQVEGSEDVEDAFQLLEPYKTYRTQLLNPKQFPHARNRIEDSLGLATKAFAILRTLRTEQ